MEAARNAPLYRLTVRSDAEFEIWLLEVDERWARTFRRATWQLAAMTVACWAAMLALILISLND